MMRSGADDYIIKPFELPDVLVRIEAVARRYSLQLRGGEGDGREGTGGKTTDRNGRTGRTGRTGGTDRTGGTGGSGRKPLSYGTITLDTESAQVTVKGEPLGLTTKEYEILRLFMENPTKLFSKANLFESVWNEEYYPEDQALKVHMSNLRSKLRKMDDFDYIETVWGMGYRLRKLG
ncbi:MAG: response regulator transcription factor [Eubacterium sp.]|nr:response regulator transcription factor [Eubacterium sp.]